MKNERWNSFDGWKKMLIESISSMDCELGQDKRISSIVHYSWKLEGHR